MKRIFLILIIIFAFSANAQERFTSNESNFAITFPDGWDISTKNEKYVVEANKNNFIGISILAKRLPGLPDSLNISYINKDTLEKIIEEQVRLQYKFSLILRSGVGMMDGVLAYYYFVQYSDLKDEFPAKYVSFQYQFVYRRIFYSIFAVCPAENYESYEKTFNDIYFTFRFIKKL
ncbi:MAG: hypothetical protein NTU73_01120 [Ignavibacteriae bacterium]|nr:hypothetical protein [Ignavibacteriota bacterium]